MVQIRRNEHMDGVQLLTLEHSFQRVKDFGDAPLSRKCLCASQACIAYTHQFHAFRLPNCAGMEVRDVTSANNGCTDWARATAAQRYCRRVCVEHCAASWVI